MLLKKHIWLWSALLLVLIFCLLSLNKGHVWGDDFALYISQAKAITDGSLYDLYETNKILVNSGNISSPYLYPQGYPILLSLLYSIAGLDFVAMKLLNVFFFLGSLSFMYFIFIKYLNSKLLSIMAVFLVGFNYQFFGFSDQIMSDFQFLFFCFFALFLMQKDSTVKMTILLSVVSFWAYFTRDAGIVILLVVMFHYFLEFNKTRRYEKALIFLSIYIVLFGIAMFIFPHGGENHFDQMFAEFSIKKNFSHYIEILELHFVNLNFNNFYWILILALIVYGLSKKIKEVLFLLIFIVLLFIVYLIWPAQQGIRFMYPIIPIIYLFLIMGLIEIRKQIQSNKNWIVLLPLFIYFGLTTYYGLKFALNISKVDTNEAYTAEMKSIYLYIDNHVSEDEFIGFNKPRALRLFTDRPTSYIGKTQKSNYLYWIDYVLLDKSVSIDCDSELLLSTENFNFYKISTRQNL